MVKALRAVAAAPGGVLFHCTAGKDRTGLMAALLLGLAGVGREEILADYQVSETYLADVICQIKTKVPDLSAFAGASKAEYLNDCLKLVETKYGSIHGYIQAIGLTEEELIALRRKLLPADVTGGGRSLGNFSDFAQHMDWAGLVDMLLSVVAILLCLTVMRPATVWRPGHWEIPPPRGSTVFPSIRYGTSILRRPHDAGGRF